MESDELRIMRKISQKIGQVIIFSNYSGQMTIGDTQYVYSGGDTH
jgi:hypothetical protein